MSEGKFVQGAVILAFTGIVIKIVGAAMRIILAALMGDEGIGLYQMAYPVYATLLTVSTAGIPVAISKLVSEKLALNDSGGAYRVYQISLGILIFTGLFFTLLLAAGADYFAENVAMDSRAYLPILVISPAIFFVTVMSAIRGFFQGFQQMGPTALSQFLEQIARVVTSVALVVYLLPLSLEYAAAGAAFGAVSGGMVSLLVLVIIFYRKKPGIVKNIQKEPLQNTKKYTTEIVGRIVSLSIPITLGSIMVPLITLMDLAVVPSRLHDAGFDMERATALYGQLTGMALSLMYFPSVIVIALAISLVPAISEAFTLKSNKLLNYRLETSNRLTIMFSLPSAVGLFMLSLPQLSNAVTVLLYDNAESAYPLAILSWGIIFLAFYLTTTGTLQGMGYTLIPVKNMFYGGVIKIFLTWLLTVNPSIHVGGAAFGTVVGFFVVAALNMYYVIKLTGYRLNAGALLIKPLISVSVMAAVVFISYRLVFLLGDPFLSFRALNAFSTLVAIICGGMVYFIVLLYSGWVKEEELLALPKVGSYLVALSKRLKLLK